MKNDGKINGENICKSAFDSGYADGGQLRHKSDEIYK